eukprot:1151390-Pelagomonas_calceolata.AAC.2
MPPSILSHIKPVNAEHASYADIANGHKYAHAHVCPYLRKPAVALTNSQERKRACALSAI